MNLREQFKVSKQKTGLTQKRAAELLGVSQWHMSRVVCGRVQSRRLTARCLALIAAQPS